MGFIYKVTNNINGKIYIGQTRRSIEERWREHIVDSYCGKKRGEFPFHRAIRKYGIEAFTIEKIDECENEILDIRERSWIKRYGSSENGYNVDLGGKGSKGQPVYQYSSDGTFIRGFETTGEALEAVGIKSIVISNERNRTSGGYILKRYKTNKLNINYKQRRCKVYQYTIDGDYIRSFKCISEATASCGAQSCTLIGQVCRGERRIAYGYRWSYEKITKLPEIRPIKRLRKVVRISLDGSEKKIYNTIKEAADDNNVLTPNIIAACKGIAKTIGGYCWKYYAS